jgi:DHA1 family tetracycline resistance protein-like MFS transporter
MQKSETAPIDRRSLIFILVTGFLNLAGVGLIAPISPFLVNQYVTSPDQLAIANGLLFTSYSLFQFLALPGLGALSDRFGRRPVLLISLFGSAIGYLIFGIGGALWVLFLGRIVDGITGANLSAIYAYIADLTPPQERTRYFGMIGSVSGFGFVIGPAIGGILAGIGGPTAPVYFAAVVTLLNVVWGYFAMPESLEPSKRSERISVHHLNPLTQLVTSFRMPQLTWLLIATLLWALPFAGLQSNLSVLAKDELSFTAQDVAGLFTMIGLIGIVMQGFVVPRVAKKFGEIRLAILAATSMTIGFLIISQIPYHSETGWIYVGLVMFALGNNSMIPTLSSLFSQSVTIREQGRVQSANQSMQAIGRVVGPTAAGALYGGLGPASPYLIGALLMAGTALAVVTASRRKAQSEPQPQ